MVTGNLIHQRTQVTWEAFQGFNAYVALRNRIFYGEMVRYTPSFSEQVIQEGDLANLYVTWYDSGSVLMHTNIDRAYLRYQAPRWEVTAGRQRINWGINTLWTPNDIFNTFNYFDFDYEERPGSDAVRVKYSPNGTALFETAFKVGRSSLDNTVAALYKFNKYGYDVQVLSGYGNGEFMLGGGWAGNIRTMGFKGEMTFLSPVAKNAVDSTSAWITTGTIDRSFNGGWYTSISYLFNSSGTDQIDGISSLYLRRVTVRNLMPFRHSASFMISKSLSPIWNTSMVLIWSPADNAFISVPGLEHSLSTNTSLLLTGQLFFAQTPAGYLSLGNSLFLRFKASF